MDGNNSNNNFNDNLNSNPNIGLNNNLHNRFNNNPNVNLNIKKRYDMTKKDVVYLFVFAASAFFTMRLGVFNTFGLGFALMCSVFVALFFAFVYNKNTENKAYGITLFVIMELLSVSFAFNHDALFKFFDIVALLILGVLCFPEISGNTVNRDGSYKEVIECFYYALVKSSESLILPFSSLKGDKASKKNRTLFQILLGLLISVPLIAVTTYLLSTYDSAFYTLVGEIFENLNVAQIIVSLVVAVIITPFIYSFSLVLEKKNTDGEKLKVTSLTPKCPPVVLNTFLLSVSVVYVIYLFSQLAYITSAFSFLLPEDYTASEFAREGFFQMLLIAAINLTLNGVTTAVVKRDENGKLPTLTKALNIFLCLFTLFFTASAFVGIVQYISKYGFTYLRTAVSAFIIMSAVIVIIMLASLFIKKMPRLRLITVTVSLTLVLISFLNIDSFVSKANYKLFEKGAINVTLNDLYSFEPAELIKLYKNGLCEKITKDDGSENFTEVDDFGYDEYYERLDALLDVYMFDRETGEFSPDNLDEVLYLAFSDFSQIKAFEDNTATLKQYEKERAEKYVQLLKEKGYVCTNEKDGVYTLYDDEGVAREVAIVNKLYDKHLIEDMDFDDFEEAGESY